MRGYAEQKVQRLPRFYDRVQAVEVILDRESDMASVEMIVTAGGKQTFVAKEVGPDALACIDLLVDKIERQLTRRKEKFRNRKHIGKRTEPYETPESSEDAGEQP
jgi:ribosomal subunit interface protein